MRAIGGFAARRCEEGKCPRCRCRCRGQAHGRKRRDVEALPLWDWHNPKNRAGRGQMLMFKLDPETTETNTNPGT